MAVRWPDGSYTGSGQAGKNPPVSVSVKNEPDTKTEPDKGTDTKEVKDADR